MLTLLRQLHRIYVLFVISVLLILFYPFYYIIAGNPRRYALLNKMRAFNSVLNLILSGIFFRFTYEEKLNRDQTYIYCANHTSNLDIMLFCLLAKGRFHFMGKDELLKNPGLRIFFNTIDIPVKRNSKISAFKAFKRAEENLKKGMSLIIFPEGGINDGPYPPVLSPFKNGPFRLAIEQNIPIVAVSMVNVWKKMWDDGSRYGTRPGICDIYVHKPILINNLTVQDSEILKARVFDLIKSKIAVK